MPELGFEVLRVMVLDFAHRGHGWWVFVAAGLTRGFWGRASNQWFTRQWGRMVGKVDWAVQVAGGLHALDDMKKLMTYPNMKSLPELGFGGFKVRVKGFPLGAMVVGFIAIGLPKWFPMRLH